MAEEKMVPVIRFIDDDSSMEPRLFDVRTRTIVIKDGKGGAACIDISEVNDVVVELSKVLNADAPPIKVVDLTRRTSV